MKANTTVEKINKLEANFDLIAAMQQQQQQTIDAIFALLKQQNEPEPEKQQKPEQKPFNHITDFFTDTPCVFEYFGRPFIACQRDKWGWCAWKTKPSKATIAKMHAAGWQYSKKRSDRSGLYCMYHK